MSWRRRRGAAAAVLLLWVAAAEAASAYQAAGVTRHADGDTFYLKKDGKAVSCTATLCAESRAVPSTRHVNAMRDKDDPSCVCKCPAENPVFREDLSICVDDFHECSLASFQNGAKKQKIPFVFLPMKGQIIHPSSDIAFSADVGEDPICVVSSAQFLTRSGWLELRNTSDTEPPLRLFRDQRHTFIQWLGEQDLRFGMEGRILLARLMCKDPSGFLNSVPLQEESPGVVTHAFSTPCIAFRVAGSQGAREVLFTSDYTMAGAGGLFHNLMGGETKNNGLSTLEYLAVGLCIMLLCLVYATSVCVYVHVRKIRKKRKRTRRDAGDDSDSERGHVGYAHHGDMNLMSEGVVKNNPLLMASGGLSNDNFTQRAGLFHNLSKNIRLPRSEMIEEQSREPESSSDEATPENDDPQVTNYHTCQDNASPISAKHKEIKAQIHPDSSTSNEPSSSSSGDENTRSHCCNNSGIYTLTLQPSTESGSLERHPVEGVSIVETLAEANVKDARDYSFLGGRHSFNSSSMGLPEMEGGCSKNCGGSHSGPYLGGVTGTRRKLYFNPAYFDPELLQTPPPAAVEFLSKLREVVALSKIKIAAKRFAPSLIGIPEETGSIVSSRTSQSVNGYAKQRIWQEQQAASTNSARCGLPDSFDACGSSKQQTIRRWLEDLDSGEPVEDLETGETIEEHHEEVETEVEINTSMPVVVAESKKEEPDAVKTPKKPVRQNSKNNGTKPHQPKRLMDAVIKELVRERGLIGEDIPSSETNTIEDKSMDSVLNEPASEVVDDPYEFIAVNEAVSKVPQMPQTPAPTTPNQRPPLMMYCLPELLAKTSGYSLVSEVYVNDGYSCSSNHSTSPGSSINRHTIKHRPPKNSVGTPSDQSCSPTSSVSENPDVLNTDDAENYPGSLTIKLPEAAPHEYRERGDEEDEQFEPDTLDRGRKCCKTRLPDCQNVCADSLERPMKIQLRSSSSFFANAATNEQSSWTPPEDVWNHSHSKKKRGASSIADLRGNQISFVSNLNKSTSGFGSLREIFEAKRQQQFKQNLEVLIAGGAECGQFKNRAARSLIAPNELKLRAHGLDSHTIDEIRQMMWSSTPSIEPKANIKPQRQRSADMAACPPTPPPPVPPSIKRIPPSLPPKQKARAPDQPHKQPHFNPPIPPRELNSLLPPPSLPPKNSRGCRSLEQATEPTRQHLQHQLQNQIMSRATALPRASADSDEDEHNNREDSSSTLGRSLEHSIDNAFTTWKKAKWERETTVRMPNRPGDSGYLSSDSNNSLKRVAEELRDQGSETEEDESLCEGGSESGGESIGTDSFFYNKARPQDSVNFGERRRDTNVLLQGGGKKRQPPPPPKRGNSKLETKVARHSNHFASNLSSKYGL